MLGHKISWKILVYAVVLWRTYNLRVKRSRLLLWQGQICKNAFEKLGRFWPKIAICKVVSERDEDF